MKSLFLFILLAIFSTSSFADDKKSAFDRVIETKTIRCGYLVYPPQISKDPNTGKMSGIAYDIIERAAVDLGFKVEWTQEVGSASWMEGLKNNHYDVLCNTAWATTIRAPHVLASIPVFFTAVNAYVRKDDHRFDKNLSLANSPDVKIATLDGATSQAIAAQSFPLAKKISLPDLTDFSLLLLEVTNNKADLTFSEASQFEDFNKKVPNALRNATPNTPVRLVQNTFFVSGDEFRLMSMINLAVQNLHNEGFIDQVLNKYEVRPNVWKRVTKPYRTTQ